MYLLYDFVRLPHAPIGFAFVAPGPDPFAAPGGGKSLKLGQPGGALSRTLSVVALVLSGLRSLELMRDLFTCGDLCFRQSEEGDGGVGNVLSLLRIAFIEGGVCGGALGTGIGACVVAA